MLIQFCKIFLIIYFMATSYTSDRALKQACFNNLLTEEMIHQKILDLPLAGRREKNLS